VTPQRKHQHPDHTTASLKNHAIAVEYSKFLRTLLNVFSENKSIPQNYLYPCMQTEFTVPLTISKNIMHLKGA
jgi:hypothetical protein